jgi:hypothetical protein
MGGAQKVTLIFRVLFLYLLSLISRGLLVCSISVLLRVTHSLNASISILKPAFLRCVYFSSPRHELSSGFARHHFALLLPLSITKLLT